MSSFSSSVYLLTQKVNGLPLSNNDDIGTGFGTVHIRYFFKIFNNRDKCLMHRVLRVIVVMEYFPSHMEHEKPVFLVDALKLDFIIGCIQHCQVDKQAVSLLHGVFLSL